MQRGDKKMWTLWYPHVVYFGSGRSVMEKASGKSGGVRRLKNFHEVPAAHGTSCTLWGRPDTEKKNGQPQ